jgi:hypothetical protein
MNSVMEVLCDLFGPGFRGLTFDPEIAHVRMTEEISHDDFLLPENALVQ